VQGLVREVLKRDGAVSSAEQFDRSEKYDQRRQHLLSCRALEQKINRRGGVRYWRSSVSRTRQTCSVGVSPTGGKVRNLRSSGRIRRGNEADEADRQSHLRDGKRVTGPQRK